jgi:hypothetical protein
VLCDCYARAAHIAFILKQNTAHNTEHRAKRTEHTLTGNAQNLLYLLRVRLLFYILAISSFAKHFILSVDQFLKSSFDCFPSEWGAGTGFVEL